MTCQARTPATPAGGATLSCTGTKDGARAEPEGPLLRGLMCQALGNGQGVPGPEAAEEGAAGTAASQVGDPGLGPERPSWVSGGNIKAGVKQIQELEGSRRCLLPSSSCLGYLPRL